MELDLNGLQLTVQAKLLGVRRAANFGGQRWSTSGLNRGANCLAALARLEPAAGRLQPLRGQKDSIIIDDSYNASPIAVKAALDVLYDFPASQRIAILGSMNEMGDLSPDMHKEVGSYCKPGQS